jgi:hypothetical protein
LISLPPEDNYVAVFLDKPYKVEIYEELRILVSDYCQGRTISENAPMFPSIFGQLCQGLPKLRNGVCTINRFNFNNQLFFNHRQIEGARILNRT